MNNGKNNQKVEAVKLHLYRKKDSLIVVINEFILKIKL